MRMSRIAAAAGLFVATLGIGTAADARPGPDGWRDGRHQGWNDGRHRGWNDHRPHGRAYGYYRNHGYRYGPRYAYRHHPRCWTEWRYHRAYRVCR